MQGYPKVLKTKFDYLFVKDHFKKSYWQKDFETLINTQYHWVLDSVLQDSEEGIVDSTHKVLTTEYPTEDVEGNEVIKTQRLQYVYKEDPNCIMFKLGFTRAEVEAILQEEDNDSLQDDQ